MMVNLAELSTESLLTYWMLLLDDFNFSIEWRLTYIIAELSVE